MLSNEVGMSLSERLQYTSLKYPVPLGIPKPKQATHRPCLQQITPSNHGAELIHVGVEGSGAKQPYNHRRRRGRCTREHPTKLLAREHHGVRMIAMQVEQGRKGLWS